MLDFKAKMHQIQFQLAARSPIDVWNLGSQYRPRRELTALPQTDLIAGFKGATSNIWRGKGGKWEEESGEKGRTGMEQEGMGMGDREKRDPQGWVHTPML